MSLYDDDDDEDYDPREFRTSVQILNNTTGKRTVTQIKVKARHDSENISQCSGYDNNNSYKALSAASSVRNLLLYYGSSSSRALGKIDKSRKPTKCEYTRDTACIKIQKLIRGFLVKRRYEIAFTQRIDSRMIIMHDAISRAGCAPDRLRPYTIEYDDVSRDAEKDLHFLISKIIDPSNVIDKSTERIMLILFNCTSHNGEFIMPDEFAILVCDVLDLPYSKTQVMNPGTNSIDFPQFPLDFNSLFNWWIMYISTHTLKVKNDSMFSFSKQFPFSFLTKFIEIRATLYDVLYSLNKFEETNKPLFECRICKKEFGLPKECSEHVIRCEKAKKKKEERLKIKPLKEPTIPDRNKR